LALRPYKQEVGSSILSPPIGWLSEIWRSTGKPELMPGRISHRCVRPRNAAILRLGRLMPIGTPVTIR
jgi:hypothetical protein